MKFIKILSFLGLLSLVLSLLSTRPQNAVETPKKSTPKKKKVVSIYPGREDKKPDGTKYNFLGLPEGRLWMTSDEWKGKHIDKYFKNNTTKNLIRSRFKAWKEIHIREFIEHMGKEVQKECRSFYFIPPSLILSQMILESNFSLSRLAIVGSNLFGHKYRGDKLGFLVDAESGEDQYLIASDDSPRDRFSKFRSQWHSLRSHSYLLMDKYSKRIKFKSETHPAPLKDWFCALCGGNNPKQTQEFIDRGGSVYATSCLHKTTYTDRLKAIIKKYNLRRFDRKK